MRPLSFALGIAALLLAAADLRAQVNILSSSDFILGIDNNRNRVGNSNTGAEGPQAAFDGNAGGTKWFTAAREFGGLIITPAGGSTTVQSIDFTTANDSSNRDPVTFQLFGMNSTVTTVSNGTGLE